MTTMTTATGKIKQSIFNIVDNLLEKSNLVVKKGTPLHALEKDIFTEVLKNRLSLYRNSSSSTRDRRCVVVKSFRTYK